MKQKPNKPIHYIYDSLLWYKEQIQQMSWDEIQELMKERIENGSWDKFVEELGEPPHVIKHNYEMERVKKTT